MSKTANIPFDGLAEANLVVDTVYLGGRGNLEEPIHYLFPKCGNMGGFRKVRRNDNSGKLAYVILYTTMSELEWPDYLDVETGVFRYYGDNRKPGHNITDTHNKGNALLEEVFGRLSNAEDRNDIPPFFIFKKYGTTGRNVQFLGLAAPGNPKISPDRDLVAFWRTMDDKRFQNYEAYFTILDTAEESITKEWLNALIDNHDDSLKKAPSVWKRFVEHGRSGIRPLMAPRIIKIPNQYEQLQSDEEGRGCLKKIRSHYKNNPYGFEACAVDLVRKMDNNFTDFNLTRPWRDGGRDAIGHYSISQGSHSNYPLKIDCALEAKCYAENNSVGVRGMSRLISRIRYRQFGILVTTSFVNSQAYSEVIEDGHPILIVTASNIADILRRNAISSTTLDDWLQSIDDEYYSGISIEYCSG